MNKKQHYERPDIGFIEIKAESGLAASDSFNDNGRPGSTWFEQADDDFDF